MIQKKGFLLSAFVLLTCLQAREHVEHTVVWQENVHAGTVKVSMQLEADDLLYKEYIHFYCDQDGIVLGEYSADVQTTVVYDQIFKENKSAYGPEITFHVPIVVEQPVDNAHIRFTYYTKSNGRIKDEYLTIPCPQQSMMPSVEVLQSVDVQADIIQQDDFPVAQESTPVAVHFDDEDDTSWYCTVSRVVERTDVLWMQLILVFLLGLLLSLTPCIYPMIPITVGILQGQGSSSLFKNLFVSLCYTAGVATMFASLGLFAAYTGTLFGTAMQHPMVIVLLTLLLAYFAGSMVGLYEMYIPSWFKPKGTVARGGSPLAAFVFGVLSGTIASPCVSPGLALVLGMVTKLANPYIGFLLLFAFGIGLSFPLLIIGTFSGALHVLPKAGVWMVEVKRLFGFMMFGMCLYLLSAVLPYVYFAVCGAIFLCVIGLFYIYKAGSNRTFIMRGVSYCLGCACIVAMIFSLYCAVRAWNYPEQCTIIGLWTDNYQCAVNQARHEHKKLLIKVEAPCCSLCRVINKKFFTQESIQQVLKQNYVPLVIDGSDTRNNDINDLIKRYAVIGFPTLLIVDADDLTLIKKWTGDVHTYSVDEFMQQLLGYATN